MAYKTAKQVAEFLQLTRQTIYDMVADGRIPAVRLSPRTIRFDLDDVLAALCRQPRDEPEPQ